MVADEIDDVVDEPARSPFDELQHLILAGLCAAGQDEATVSDRFKAVRQIRDEYFDGLYAGVWRVVQQYYAITGTAPAPGDFDELLERAKQLPLPRKVEYSHLYRAISDDVIPASRFRFAMLRLAERWRDREFAQTLESALRIHTGSIVVGDERTPRAGFSDALDYLQAQIAYVTRAQQDGTPEGDINGEAQQVLREYHEAKRGVRTGILSGFPSLDAVTHGLQPGELMLIAGYSGEGKSKVTYNLAYHACYEQGKNVLFGTLEATRRQVRANLVVRHSQHERFNLPGGLRYSAFRHGALTDGDEQALRTVLTDMRQGAESGRYGVLDVFQMPHRATAAYLSEKLLRESKHRRIDLVVVDYLGLMASAQKRPTNREELNDLIVAAKRLAVDGNNGDGVAVISPWQVSRDAWRQAQQDGYYTKASLAETAQAERSSDLILSILRTGDSSDVLAAKVLKYRDGEEATTFTLTADFGGSFVSESELTLGALGI